MILLSVLVGFSLLLNVVCLVCIELHNKALENINESFKHQIEINHALKSAIFPGQN